MLKFTAKEKYLKNVSTKIKNIWKRFLVFNWEKNLFYGWKPKCKKTLTSLSFWRVCTFPHFLFFSILNQFLFFIFRKIFILFGSILSMIFSSAGNSCYLSQVLFCKPFFVFLIMCSQWILLFFMYGKKIRVKKVKVIVHQTILYKRFLQEKKFLNHF